jgi:di/tricarboxylate transporter
MVVWGILTQQEVRDSINWEIYVTIAGAFGIGKALVNSGVAGGVATGLASVGTGLGIGPAGTFAMIYLATFLISNVVTNNAAAALIFPIAIDVATQADVDPIQMSYCVMLSASASFMSPFGYQTNLMVYGPGGYKYVDFLKFGFPMQVILWLFTVAILAVDGTLANLAVIWLASLAFLAVVALGRWRWEIRTLKREGLWSEN